MGNHMSASNDGPEEAGSILADTLAREISLHLCTPDMDSIKEREITSTTHNSRTRVGLKDMELECSGNRCRLVPSPAAKRQRLNSEPQRQCRKRNRAPLPPTLRTIQEKTNLEITLVREISLDLSGAEETSSGQIHTNSDVTTSNEQSGGSTKPSPRTGGAVRRPVLTDIDWLLQNYYLVGELEKMPGCSEIEYIV